MRLSRVRFVHPVDLPDRRTEPSCAERMGDRVKFAIELDERLRLVRITGLAPPHTSVVLVPMENVKAMFPATEDAPPAKAPTAGPGRGRKPLVEEAVEA